ncbi:SMC-Scp complex subunit ScpB [Bacillus sp. V5-8f]|uniref:SMC-Scp complex subunit ScpB n=1 Tax=Bacillus sp. V5-8f TaxID=2053044 RepID=UPI000C77161B|nr:SMC-Scp complex subunit ScpB [Bacillus sp. V5-8f]PLT34820.1 SMC-Scp complex subunit ScpB [Bacillus sp. V5-8f]
MEVINWKSILEALLFAAGDEGLSPKQISTVLDITEIQAVDIVESLKADYEDDTRGIHLLEIAGVYQLATKKEHSAYLKRLVEAPGAHGLSQAALETLAIIAYRQPITRAEIEEIRGVKTERPLSTLVSKVLVKEVGRAEGSGRAYLYGTTKEFLDYFGLNSLDELPPLSENGEEGYEQEEADLFFGKFQDTIE